MRRMAARSVLDVGIVFSRLRIRQPEVDAVPNDFMPYAKALSPMRGSSRVGRSIAGLRA